MKAYWLLLMLAGGLGSLARYALSLTVNNYIGTVSVLGTFVVNLLGCFAFGLLYALFDNYAVATPYRVLTLAGFLGGFTTFSAFAGEAVLLFQAHRCMQSLVYIVMSNVCCLAAAWLGFVLVRAMVK
jgi:fluoride exporter